MGNRQIQCGFRVKSVDREARTAVFTISTDDVDRDGEVLLPEGADLTQYRKNPVVLWVHDYGKLPIGKSLETWIEKNGRASLMAKMEFAPTEFAGEVFELVAGDFLNTASVGFLPEDFMGRAPSEVELKERPDWAKATRLYDKWDLLEWSIVPVPSNPYALSRAMMKGLKLPKGMVLDLPVVAVRRITTDDEIREQVEAEGGPVDYTVKILKPLRNYDAGLLSAGIHLEEKWRSDRPCMRRLRRAINAVWKRLLPEHKETLRQSWGKIGGTVERGRWLPCPRLTIARAHELDRNGQMVWGTSSGRTGEIEIRESLIVLAPQEIVETIIAHELLHRFTVSVGLADTVRAAEYWIAGELERIGYRDADIDDWGAMYGDKIARYEEGALPKWEMSELHAVTI